MDEIVKDFLIESNENLDRLDQELVKLESSPSSRELLASIFRTIHTIKGSCGFLGFARLEKLTHAGENLLSQLRDGKLTLTAEITTGLLSMVDAVRQAAKGSGEISHNIQGVASAAESTTRGAQDTLQAAQQLTAMAVQLRSLVEQFKLSDSGTTAAAGKEKTKAHAARA
jgi:two-component system, chemotaxis family, sensor kinase CheA